MMEKDFESSAAESSVQQKITQVTALIERMRELERDNRYVLSTNEVMRNEFEQLMAALESRRAVLESRLESGEE